MIVVSSDSASNVERLIRRTSQSESEATPAWTRVGEHFEPESTSMSYAKEGATDGALFGLRRPSLDLQQILRETSALVLVAAGVAGSEGCPCRGAHPGGAARL
jgi:hypothetical protein